jgi:hypothetical protein
MENNCQDNHRVNANKKWMLLKNSHKYKTTVSLRCLNPFSVAIVEYHRLNNL